MKCLEMIMEDIDEEVEGAQHYAELAVKYREHDRDLAEGYYNMSKQESGHAENLYAQGHRIMAKKQETDPETYHRMLWAWERQHGHMMHGLAKAKILQDMFRG